MLCLRMPFPVPTRSFRYLFGVGIFSQESLKNISFVLLLSQQASRQRSAAPLMCSDALFGSAVLHVQRFMVNMGFKDDPL